MKFKITMTDEECVVLGEYEVELTTDESPSEEDTEGVCRIHPDELEGRAFRENAVLVGENILSDMKAVYFQKIEEKLKK